MEPITNPTENFDSEVLHSGQQLLLDFWAR